MPLATWPRSSCPWPGGCRRRRRRPTSEICASTSFPGSADRLGRLPADEIEKWLNDERGPTGRGRRICRAHDSRRSSCARGPKTTPNQSGGVDGVAGQAGDVKFRSGLRVGGCRVLVRVDAPDPCHGGFDHGTAERRLLAQALQLVADERGRLTLAASWWWWWSCSCRAGAAGRRHGALDRSELEAGRALALRFQPGTEDRKESGRRRRGGRRGRGGSRRGCRRRRR